MNEIVTSAVGLMLILGSYGYTFKVTANTPRKSDIEDLRDRVNILYEHLLKKSLDKEVEKRKNGH